MEKSKYQQCFHCFIVCILVPYASWFRSLLGFRLLFDARRLLEEIWYSSCKIHLILKLLVGHIYITLLPCTTLEPTVRHHICDDDGNTGRFIKAFVQ